eukprot:CAMPEP_0197443358 /NCGR_PEP_ID=MMETSP1175-20131217/9110_1 /TAXON_ID=1003142 /ORGANISM="Triceratium dubium, Strain CCMP147" /LENGTH=269 /DNA_ID=CAMNT_0042973975 /DNA_START=104 /DNA_END=914 /DNA_ORIENTATION=-
MKFYLLVIAAVVSLPGVLARIEGDTDLEAHERDLEADEFYVEGDFYDESELEDLMGKKKKYGCCYQPWGGDGHGGCSTANWCNRSKKACKTCDGDFYDYEDYYGDSEQESVSNLMGKKKYGCCYQPWGGDGHGGCSTSSWCNYKKENCDTCDGDWKKYKYSDSSKKSKPPKKTKKSKPYKKTKTSETKKFKSYKGCGSCKYNPCTKDAIKAGKFYHEHCSKDKKYLQCNEWGKCYEMDCGLTLFGARASTLAFTRSTETRLSREVYDIE